MLTQGIQVERLKDKLGTRQLPTAELRLRGARALKASPLGCPPTGPSTCCLTVRPSWLASLRWLRLTMPPAAAAAPTAPTAAGVGGGPRHRRDCPHDQRHQAAQRRGRRLLRAPRHSTGSGASCLSRAGVAPGRCTATACRVHRGCASEHRGWRLPSLQDYARRRRVFGLLLAEQPLAQRTLAWMQVQSGASLALVLDVARLQGEMPGRLLGWEARLALQRLTDRGS